MRLNPNIVPQKQLGTQTNHEKTITNTRNFFHSNGFCEIESKVHSDTMENLIWGLTPTYSPLYQNGQLDMNDTNYINQSLDTNDAHYLDILSNFLKEKYGDNPKFTNKSSLASQFSGIMIKNLLIGDYDKMFIVDRLFRPNNKDYYQLECGTKNNSLAQNIQIMSHFLDDIFGKSFSLVSMNSKFFYFVSASFQFDFRSDNGEEISLVGGYIDNELAKEFNRQDENLFIFGIKIDKLTPHDTTNQNNFQSTISKEKSIIIESKYKDELTKMKDYLQYDMIENNNEIVILPKKLTRLDLFSKEKFYQLIGVDNFISGYCEYGIMDNTLHITGPRKEVYFESFAYFLQQYYSGEIIENTDHSLKIKFSNFDPKWLEKIFNAKEKKIIDVSKNELINVLGFDIDLLSEKNQRVLDRLGYDIDEKGSSYEIGVSKSRTDIASSFDVIADISEVFSESLIHNDTISHAIDMNKKNNLYKYTNETNDYFVNKLYNQKSFSSLIKNKKDEIEQDFAIFFEDLFGSSIYYDHGSKVLINNLSLSLIQSIISNTDKYPKKLFSHEYLTTIEGRKDHIGLVIKYSKDNFDEFNNIYSEIFTLLTEKFMYKNCKLVINDDIPFLINGASFDIVVDLIRKGYIGVLDNIINKKLKGFTIISEFIL